jgi:hypothetical protein
MDPYSIVAEHEYPRLHLFLKRSFQALISDIRGLLRLPYAHLKTGCSLAFARQLFSLIGGISVCLYNASYEDFIQGNPKKSGAKFKGVLKDYYPWEYEQLTKEDAVVILYDSTRNPIEHCLGLYKPHERNRSQIVKSRLSPKKIEEIENSEARPHWLPPAITLSQSGFYRYDINTLSLYWGVFRLISNLLKDKKQLEKSEEFQMHLWDDYTIKSLESTLELIETLGIDTPEGVEQAGVVRHHLSNLNEHNLTETQLQAIQSVEAKLTRVEDS